MSRVKLSLFLAGWAILLGGVQAASGQQVGTEASGEKSLMRVTLSNLINPRRSWTPFARSSRRCERKEA